MGAAEVIFRARAADGREFPVAVEIEFDLTLAPQLLLRIPQPMTVPT